MFKLFTAVFIFTSFHFNLIAQNYSDLDSLQSELQKYTVSKTELENGSTTQRDTSEVKILFKISRCYSFNNFEKAREYAQRCIDLAEKINYKKGLVDGNYSLTAICLNIGNDTLAIAYANKTISIAEKIGYNRRIADAHVHLGFINNLLGNMAKAQEETLIGLRLAEKLNYKECIATAYSNLGSINSVLGNLDKEFQYYSTALEIARGIDYKIQIASNCHNLGTYYAGKEINDKALLLINEALKVNKEIGNKLWEAYNFDALGVIHENMGDSKSALNYSLQSATILKELGAKFKLCTTLNNIGWMYMSLGEFKKARNLLDESIKCGLEIKYLDGLWGTYESLVTLDSIEGKWKLAYQHHLQVIVYRDSVNSQENIKKTTESGLKFEFDKKQLSDSLRFLQEKSISNIKFKQQRAYTYGGFLIVLVTVVLLFFVYRNFRKQQEANRMLKEAQEQLIKSEKLAAFGVMASRVAHEIQNPLNFVNNFSDISKDLVKELVVSSTEQESKEISEILIDNLQRINEHGKRAANIVSQLQEHTLKGTAHEFFEPRDEQSEL